ncbi:23S rRNA (uracil(1939)-C(5))-methyltransferase RlmD [Proteiniclasticum sp. BAD-10]|uniref:23S rRNA (Uracil(1939)-C(5))-methyltransferase RlmD n=1 Tax=Proteiniclasticum sediminis TaxID=2804028 RepID=A0A941CN51_9CLOT|nr:23S rRNA (uracil(1939)-C(5))-methyltransferase RlmD [Proteiniclasticum sediminis]MBR0575132.1 23S rRNA (uracil(1939)-C(5))-methyltransferase RlmD [Proteiniclasticum sediminis]
MKRNELIEVKIEDHSFPATGIGFLEGKRVKIKGAFVGETVSAKAYEIRQDRAKGRFQGRTSEAEYAVEAPCPHFGRCGGCISQQIPLEKQRQFKEEEVKKLFKQNDVPLGEYLGMTGSREQYGYRNKMEYTFGDEVKDGELNLGMHFRGMKNSVINTSGCLLVSEDFRKIHDYTIAYCRKNNLPYYRVMRKEGYLRNLIIRRGMNTGELMVNLVTTTQLDFDLAEYRDGLLSLALEEKLVSLLHTENDSFSDAVIPEKVNILHGQDYLTEKLGELTFKISPFSFFQTNTQGAEVLYREVKALIGEKKKEIFDLYCGTGTIGQIVADCAEKVTGVEIIEEAVVAANENAAINGLSHVQFLAGDVKDVIQTLEGAPDLIILDPPRSGVHPKALEYVKDFQAKEIIYVSCNPKTLVIDLKYLIDQGYQVEKTKIVDLFPNTPHIEVIVKLGRELNLGV